MSKAARELREKLLAIVENGEAYTEETVDRVLDAVTEALPPDRPMPNKEHLPFLYFFRYGANKRTGHIKSLLETAKGDGNY